MKIIQNLSLIIQNINLAKFICFPALALNLLKGLFERSKILFLTQLSLRFTRVPDRNDSGDWVKTSAGAIIQAGKFSLIILLCVSTAINGGDFLKQFVKSDASQKFFVGVIEEKQK